MSLLFYQDNSNSTADTWCLVLPKVVFQFVGVGTGSFELQLLGQITEEAESPTTKAAE